MASHTAAHQTSPPQRADPQRAAARPAERMSIPARAGIGRLQRALGNSGMHRLLRSGAIQAKLTVGPADDQYEREADRMADEVMRMPEAAAGSTVQRTTLRIQRACAECEREEKTLQRQSSATASQVPVQINRKCATCEDPEEEKPIVQAKRSHSDPPETSSSLESYVASSRGSGQPLASSTRAYFEPRFGHSFDHVRVHTDSHSAQASQEISALAFTAGSDIYFAHGQYTPGTVHGDRLLGHELTHVLQQDTSAHAATTSDRQPARRTVTPVSGLAVQRVADKSDVPAMVCTPDPAPGTPVGTNIMFGSADRTLDAGDKAQIAADHAAWLARGGIDTLTVDGFASSEDSARNNWTLSCDRAEAVKAEFVRLGVPAGMVTTIAHGETEEFSTASRPPNRRAVVSTVSGTPPALVIFPVSFGASANRVPPGITVPVIVFAVGVPAGRSIDLDIQGSGGANGTATVAPATITGAAIVSVTGGVQTTPGSAGSLLLRARMGGLTLGTSTGFTVAAHPTNFSVTLNSDLNTATQVGLLANNAWTSDGTGGVAELDQIQRGEAIAQGHQDNPPYSSGLGAPSGKTAGNVSPRVDTHAEPKAAINTSVFLVLRGRRFTDVVNQLFIFDDARTGLLNQTAVNSGFTITSTLSFNASRSGWDEQTVKTGAATTVGARTATAGAGTATSLVHPL